MGFNTHPSDKTDNPVFLLWIDPSIHATMRGLLKGEDMDPAERPRLGKAKDFARALYPGHPLGAHYVTYAPNSEAREAWLERQQKEYGWEVLRIVRDGDHHPIEQTERVLLELLDSAAQLSGHLVLALGHDYGRGAISARLREHRQMEEGRLRRVSILHFSRSSQLLETPFEQYDLVKVGIVPERIYARADEIDMRDDEINGRAEPLLSRFGNGNDKQRDSASRAGPRAPSLLSRASNGVAQFAQKVRSAAPDLGGRHIESTGSVTIPLGDRETLVVRRESARR